MKNKYNMEINDIKTEYNEQIVIYKNEIEK